MGLQQSLRGDAGNAREIELQNGVTDVSDECIAHITPELRLMTPTMEAFRSRSRCPR